MPGSSALEAARVIAGELPDLVHVVELPQRGPGADMIGRTGGMLAGVEIGFCLETTSEGWRLAGSLGRQMRRAQSLLAEDLDALEATSEGYRGPVKCQVVGPWTMAASVELRSGERMLRDPGAVDELADALAHAVATQVADLRRRVPVAARVLVQVDEPALPAVLEGRIGTASGLSTYSAVDPQRAGVVLGRVLGAAATVGAHPGVHCCAAQPPIGMMRAAGSAFVSVDISGVDAGLDLELGALLESGTGLIAGCIPSAGSGTLSDTAASAPLRALLHRLGLEDPRHLQAVAVSPTCGLAAASPAWSRAALSACAAVGRVLRQDDAAEVPDGG
jgi:methionine synthase II (cobalamin-independent)